MNLYSFSKLQQNHLVYAVMHKANLESQTLSTAYHFLQHA